MTQPDLTDFGSLLRWWRGTRRFSQLQLAAAAEVSSRHLSFLQTGRARPSREMVVHLAPVLDIPLRDRNELLHAAGFAAVYTHEDVSAPKMDAIRRVLRRILDASEPNPAVVVDRTFDLVDANAAALDLLDTRVEPQSAALLPTINLNRIALHPEDIRGRTENWHEFGATILRRLELECRHRQADSGLRDLIDEVLGYEGVLALTRHPLPRASAGLVIPMRVTTLEGEPRSFISTIAAIGGPNDVTVDELRLETFYLDDPAGQ